MLTKQEMFTRAFLGLRAQGWRPSVDEYGNCRYNGTDGCRCAWGHVDPVGTADEESAEGINVWALAERKIGLAAKLSPSESAFAGKLQAAHDDVVDTGWGCRPDMEANLRALAADHGLEVPE